MKTKEFSADFDLIIRYSDWGYDEYINKRTGKIIKVPCYKMMNEQETLWYLRKRLAEEKLKDLQEEVKD